MMPELKIENQSKTEVFQTVADYLSTHTFKIIKLDILRPWGFFFYVDEEQTEKFIEHFYGRAELEGIDTSLSLQPKILAIESGKKLSWQYHNRRSEIWRCIAGSVAVIENRADDEPSPQIISGDDLVTFPQGIRHRASGNNEWGIVAEIWQHTDPQNPSDENDIVRLQDDFGRS
ncbi:MAG TPA: hypothetical protein VLE51_00950 [Candidatus Saccharimonadales bacterium]|nr:hypothetical protein [Candidatus Saccharimonadales bacterium]